MKLANVVNGSYESAGQDELDVQRDELEVVSVVEGGRVQTPIQNPLRTRLCGARPNKAMRHHTSVLGTVRTVTMGRCQWTRCLLLITT